MTFRILKNREKVKEKKNGDGFCALSDLPLIMGLRHRAMPRSFGLGGSYLICRGVLSGVAWVCVWGAGGISGAGTAGKAPSYLPFSLHLWA